MEKQNLKTLEGILEKHNKLATSLTDKGDRFENLIVRFLKTAEPYKSTFKKVWLWNDFPFRKDFGGKDIGIDIVGYTINSEYWAIQCKFYGKNSSVSKDDIDTFIATAGKKFNNGKRYSLSFSERLIISTTNKWSKNAEKTIENQTFPITRLNCSDLSNFNVDWKKIDNGVFGKEAKLPTKNLRDYQQDALKKALAHFNEFDRGQLIMACGTGKTLTALRIAEKITPINGVVLYLVPSISLLRQTLQVWNAESNRSLFSLCVCSDTKVNSRINTDEDSTASQNIGYPASTDVSKLKKAFQGEKKDLRVIFSTYHSIEKVSLLQKELNGFVFDLIICDEAHQTTGVTYANDDDSHFVQVHQQEFIQAKKRMYMTATPRLYSQKVKKKAREMNATLCSMDDETKYGKKFYRIGFSEAVNKNVLSDYKVLILQIPENNKYACQLAGENKIKISDTAKLIGCVNALSKKLVKSSHLIPENDKAPMKTALAFCYPIPNSKKITNYFNEVDKNYRETLNEGSRSEIVSIASEHIDGSMTSPERSEKLKWLEKSNTTGECRVITNVQCLSEGVDVPALDAVMFLSNKNSEIAVVQSVGRVMRKAPGKHYGYIIIPVVVPANVEPGKALYNHKNYKVIWTVLNALRAHDDRFNAMINKLAINKQPPENLIIDGPHNPDDLKEEIKNTTKISDELLYGKIVEKVGERTYWENWAKDIGDLQKKEVARIKELRNNYPEKRKLFNDFVVSLQKNIHPDITETQCLDFLGQHLISKPVFDALFENYNFFSTNVVSKATQEIIEKLGGQSFRKDSKKLEKFYEDVKRKVEGIDNAKGKQEIIKDLYGTFFKIALPKLQSQLGIVYTPIEIIDFILHSVADLLKKEFNRDISSENVHILDPFTGTGTFITRLLQSHLIKKEDFERKYRKEIHANELVLLAYYIANVNIENTYYEESKIVKHEPYKGIVLTDTFNLSSKKGTFNDSLFPDNSERVKAQKNTPIQVIIGNPPYSAGQKSVNDDAKNYKHKELEYTMEKSIENTYVAKATGVKLKRTLYDPYFKAFRWASNTITDGKKGGGNRIYN